MMDKLSHPAVLWVSRWLLGSVFLYAAYSKITDLAGFAKSISHYDMVPVALIPLFATILAGVEVSAGLTLLTGLWRRGTAQRRGAYMCHVVQRVVSAVVQCVLQYVPDTE